MQLENLLEDNIVNTYTFRKQKEYFLFGSQFRKCKGSNNTLNTKNKVYLFFKN